MNIQIVGAGAVGLLVATYLQQSGMDVTLVVRSEEQRDAIEEQGVTLIRDNLMHTTKEIMVTTNLLQNMDLTIVTTKSYHLQSIHGDLEQLPKQAAILFMQNGLGHYEYALNLPQQNVAFSSVQFGALKENATTVKHTGIGIWKLAVGKGALHKFNRLFDCSNGYFPIELVEDAYAMLFEKALLNCFINPLTAILQVRNGALIENVQAYNLLKQLYTELSNAFPVDMEQFPFEAVESLCKKTSMNMSSMLMDRLNERPSEVESIVRPVIDRANNAGIQLPTLQMLYSLMMVLETERERQR